MKYKINDIIFTERYTHTKNGEEWTQYTTNTGDFDLQVRSPRYIEELGAVLVKEPRTMPVGEFPEQIRFKLKDGPVYEWVGGVLHYHHPEYGDLRTVRTVVRSMLKSIGTEVLDE